MIETRYRNRPSSRAFVMLVVLGSWGRAVPNLSMYSGLLRIAWGSKSRRAGVRTCHCSSPHGTWISLLAVTLVTRPSDLRCDSLRSLVARIHSRRCPRHPCLCAFGGSEGLGFSSYRPRSEAL
ncbi:hypothetical protein GE09DRAFT_545860 [Coniochaeta sp. 2T2.1]|nr:hypothetical protein GE09DRAFT_545860 [Coniochaeta sp. 2T2.1]